MTVCLVKEKSVHSVACSLKAALQRLGCGLRGPTAGLRGLELLHQVCLASMQKLHVRVCLRRTISITQCAAVNKRD